MNKILEEQEYKASKIPAEGGDGSEEEREAAKPWLSSLRCISLFNDALPEGERPGEQQRKWGV